MEITHNLKHNKEPLYYALSQMLERAAYYGFRALIALYMISETIGMKKNEAFFIYGSISTLLLFSRIIGAVFGDLLIGNKRSIILGGIFQAIGIFSLCIPSNIDLYLGLFLIIIGNGLFSPNITSNFGKLFLNKPKLIDSGFMAFHLAINLGSFLGVLLIGYIGNTFGYRIGFIFSGILTLLSILPIFTPKEKIEIQIPENRLPIGKRALNIVIGLFIVGLFWACFSISNSRISYFQFQFRLLSDSSTIKQLWQSAEDILMIPIALVAIIIWASFYKSQSFKLMLGFFFGILSLGILFFIPSTPTEQHILIYVLSLICLGISEIHIAPMIHSILTKYSNPKYLAILISISLIPTKLLSFVFSFLNTTFLDSSTTNLIISIILMTIIGIGLMLYIRRKKKANKTPYINHFTK